LCSFSIVVEEFTDLFFFSGFPYLNNPNFGVLVFAGASNVAYQNDMHFLDLVNQQWVQVLTLCD
jgi:hypothetical protein